MNGDLMTVEETPFGFWAICCPAHGRSLYIDRDRALALHENCRVLPPAPPRKSRRRRVY